MQVTSSGRRLEPRRGSAPRSSPSGGRLRGMRADGPRRAIMLGDLQAVTAIGRPRRILVRCGDTVLGTHRARGAERHAQDHACPLEEASRCSSRAQAGGQRGAGQGPWHRSLSPAPWGSSSAVASADIVSGIDGRSSGIDTSRVPSRRDGSQRVDDALARKPLDELRQCAPGSSSQIATAAANSGSDNIDVTGKLRDESGDGQFDPPRVRWQRGPGLGRGHA
jgi:hypothetical protein